MNIQRHRYKWVILITVLLSTLGVFNGYLNAEEQRNYINVSGYIEVDFNYSQDVESQIKSGFNVKIEGSSLTTVTDSEGYFKILNIPVSKDSCNIVISKNSYLERTIKDIKLQTDVVLSTISSPLIMWAGDMGEQDKAINMGDILSIARSFNSVEGRDNYNAAVDVNRDGAVNMVDIMIIVKNYQKTTSDYKNIGIQSEPVPTPTISIPNPSGLNDWNIVSDVVINSDQYVLADDGVDTAVVTPVFYNKYNKKIENPYIDLQYFINGILTDKRDFNFKECGVYKISIQAGIVNSNVIELKVVPKYTISISVDKPNIVADGADKAILTEKITDKSGREIKPEGLVFTIITSNRTYQTQNREFIARESGSYIIYASVENYKSNIISIYASQFYRLKLSLSKTEIIGDGKENVEFIVELYDIDNNRVGYYPADYYVNDKKISGSMYSSTITGEYSVYAMYNNLKSEILNFTILPTSLKADPGNDIVTLKTFKVSLDASDSTVPPGKTISYNWRIISKPSDSYADLNDSHVVNPYFIPEIEGEYVLGLTVDDGTAISDEKTINVKAKGFGSTTDEFNSPMGGAYIPNYEADECIPLSDGWIIVKDKILNKIIIKNVMMSSLTGKEFLVKGNPDKMEFDFDRDLLLVSLSDINMIAKINMITDEITYISIDGTILQMTVGEPGIVFVQTNKNNNGGAILVIDTVKEEILSKFDNMGAYNFMVYDRNGNNLYSRDAHGDLARFSFNEITNELKPMQCNRELGSSGSGLAVSNDGKHVAYCYLAHGIYDIDSSDITKKLGQWDFDQFQKAVNFSLDNKYLVALNYSQIKIFDVETYKEVATVANVDSYYDNVFFSRGGKIVYVVCKNSMKYFKISQ